MSLVKEQLVRSDIVARARIMTPAGPIPSPFTTTLLVPIIVFIVLATAAVGLRIRAARLFSPSKWKTPDLWLIISALVVTYGCVITNIVGAAVVGFNYMDDRLSLADAGKFTFKVYFADVITQTTASGLVKLSILEFYKRIFVKKGFKLTCHVMSFLVAAWMIGTIFTQIFSCTPISAGWNPELQIKDANYNYATAFLAIFGIGLALDVLVLCLPLGPIYKLQLVWSRKIKVYMIFALGFFCVICAAVRFYYTYEELYNVFEATAEEKATIAINACLWSILEPEASIIAACLPTYGILIQGYSLTSMKKSVTSFFSNSIHSSRNSSTLGSGKASLDDSSSETDSTPEGLNALRGHQATHKTDIEATLARPRTETKDGFIHTTTEVTVSHDEKWHKSTTS